VARLGIFASLSRQAASHSAKRENILAHSRPVTRVTRCDITRIYRFVPMNPTYRNCMPFDLYAYTRRFCDRCDWFSANNLFRKQRAGSVNRDETMTIRASRFVLADTAYSARTIQPNYMWASPLRHAEAPISPDCKCQRALESRRDAQCWATAD